MHCEALNVKTSPILDSNISSPYCENLASSARTNLCWTSYAFSNRYICIGLQSIFAMVPVPL
jgi:hypothetical protein